LATLLTGQPGCTVTGQVASAADLHEAVQIYRPQVAVWDLGESGTALERFGSTLGIPIVVLLRTEAEAAGAWAAGVRGLLLRQASGEHLAAAVIAVTQGLAVVDPELLASLVPPRAHQPAEPLEPLTPREIEVLQWLAEGEQNKEIARRLGISEHTVKFHVNAILGKLNVSSRTEAVVRATRLGLILL
jgi:two-component system, NarL family, nitrate/nitrite response regulator NarL